MSNYSSTASRSGQAASATDKKGLFLKVFAGEVLTAFNTNNIGMGVTRVRTITSGKSASFPLTGLASAVEHAAGTEIVPNKLNHNETLVSINNLLTSSAFVANIDEAMNHYDVRSIYSKEIGQALAKAADVNIFKSIANASVGKDNSGTDLLKGDTTVTSGGTVLTATDTSAITGAAGADFIFEALQTLDEKNVTGERYVVLPPALYYAMFKGTVAGQAAFMSSDFGSGGNSNTGTVPMIGGAKVFMSNNLPATEAAYSAGASAAGDQILQGLVFTKDAAATVKLLDLGVESEYLIQNQGTLMVAKYAMGHDALRGECAVRLVRSTSA